VGRAGRHEAQAVEIIADSVQFLGGRQDAEGGSAPVRPERRRAGRQRRLRQLGADDDIPF
jgi:single-stranded DNA-binding protein